MRFAYADPPYLGCGASHYGYAEWDDPERHRQLIAQLMGEWPEGWALSLHTPSLAIISPMMPEGVRWGAWCKSFASFKPNVNPAYAWEPVAFYGGRQKRSRDEPTVRDFVVCPITLKRGLTGAKPEAFCRWVFAFLGAQPADDFTDLFPGSGAVTRAWESFSSQHSFAEAGNA
jgi:hypothetical protein